MAAAARPVASCTCSKPSGSGQGGSRSSERATIRRGSSRAWPPRIALNSSLLPPDVEREHDAGSSRARHGAPTATGLRTPRERKSAPEQQAPAVPHSTNDRNVAGHPCGWQPWHFGSGSAGSVVWTRSRWTAARTSRTSRARPEALVALSCPGERPRARGADARDARLDKDGRVRATEVLAALRWCAERLKDLGAHSRRRRFCRSTRFDETKPAGGALLGAARQILAKRGIPGRNVAHVADVADVSRVFEGTRFNGTESSRRTPRRLRNCAR